MIAADGMATPYTETQRMVLRSHVNLAGEVIIRLWPMRTIIARNSLQGLEHMSFEEAVRRGEQLFGGQGSLPHAAFREAFLTGRIRARHVDAVLKPLASEKQILFGERRLSHLDVLRATMVHGLQRVRPVGAPSVVDASLGEARATVEPMTQWIQPILSPEAWSEMERFVSCEPEEWPYQERWPPGAIERSEPILPTRSTVT